MSDGSSIVEADVTDTEHMDALFQHMKTLITSVGAKAVMYSKSHKREPKEVMHNGHTVHICGHDMTRILMLAVLGNFVTNPTDPSYSSQSAKESLATVVVDHTGSLVVINSFTTMRTYFLETLLLVSIITIARLSLVKKVTFIKSK